MSQIQATQDNTKSQCKDNVPGLVVRATRYAGERRAINKRGILDVGSVVLNDVAL